MMQYNYKDSSLYVNVSNYPKYDRTLHDFTYVENSISENVDSNSVFLVIFSHPILRLVNTYTSLSNVSKFRISKPKGLSKNANNKRVHNEAHNV